jgi:hypothetical protein
MALSVRRICPRETRRRSDRQRRARRDAKRRTARPFRTSATVITPESMASAGRPGRHPLDRGACPNCTARPLRDSQGDGGALGSSWTPRSRPPGRACRGDRAVLPELHGQPAVAWDEMDAAIVRNLDAMPPIPARSGPAAGRRGVQSSRGMLAACGVQVRRCVLAAPACRRPAAVSSSTGSVSALPLRPSSSAARSASLALSRSDARRRLHSVGVAAANDPGSAPALPQAIAVDGPRGQDERIKA